MLGESVAKPPLPKLKPRPVPKLVDVPGNLPYSYGHIAREPNTVYKIQLAHYRREEAVRHKKIIEQTEKALYDVKVQKNFIKHFENRTYRTLLNNKVNNKLKEDEERLEERREKLKQLFWKEEREYLKEIVDEAQKSKQRKLEEKIEHINEFQKQKEDELEATVKEKRQRQYLARCEEFRPLISKQRNKEAKETNLIQMKENEARRKSEKEFDHFWDKINDKYCEARDEKDEQERLKKVKQINEFKFYSDLQAKEKMTKEQKMEQEKLEEKERLDQLRKSIVEQERLELEMKRKKDKETCDLFKTQLKEREEWLQRVTEKEKSIQRAYDKLSAEELAKDQAAIKAKVSTAHDDIIKFKEYLANFRQEREEELQRMKKVTSDTMKAIQQKQDDAKCKEELKRKALLQNVLKARAEQIEYRKKQKEESQKAIEAEQELAKATDELNRKLRLQYEQQSILNVQKYRADLEQQISYKKMLQEREKEKEREILEASEIENQKYNQIVADVMSGNVRVSETHVFRKVINNEKCPCLKPNY